MNNATAKKVYIRPTLDAVPMFKDITSRRSVSV